MRFCSLYMFWFVVILIFVFGLVVFSLFKSRGDEDDDIFGQPPDAGDLGGY